MRRLLLPLFLLCPAFPAFSAVEGQEVSYVANGTTLKGWLAYDAKADEDSWLQLQRFLNDVLK